MLPSLRCFTSTRAVDSSSLFFCSEASWSYLRAQPPSNQHYASFKPLKEQRELSSGSRGGGSQSLEPPTHKLLSTLSGKEEFGCQFQCLMHWKYKIHESNKNEESWDGEIIKSTRKHTWLPVSVFDEWKLWATWIKQWWRDLRWRNNEIYISTHWNKPIQEMTKSVQSHNLI